MSEIWIVFGNCGDYYGDGDKLSWSVIAYTKKSDAEWHAHLAQFWSDQYGKDWWSSTNKERELNKPSFDPFYQTDFDGTTYTVEPLQLHDSFEKYL